MAIDLNRKSAQEVIDAAQELVAGTPSDSRQLNKYRIKAILNGGSDGIRALLGNQMDTADADLLPAPNLLQSGIDRLAQKISGVPQVRVDVMNNNDSERSRLRAEKLERIVASYDEKQRLNLQLAQAARWLPGYGYCAWVITSKMDKNGFIYPCAELRDPYDTFPGNFGPDQQPQELAILRSVPRWKLAQIYPEYKNIILKPNEKKKTGAVGNASTSLIGYDRGNTQRADWEDNTGQGVDVIEYYDITGTYIVYPETRQLFDYIPNPLSTVPFVFMKRFSFDELKGQYDHTIGLMAMMAKINIMSAIAMEDAVFTETNISGELESGQYRKGRFAVNYLAPGTQVSKPANNIPYQLFQQVDRLERQLRLVGGYPVTDDAQSPASVATGAGLAELNSSMSLMINEYREIIKVGVSEMDNKRLELDEIITLETGIQSKPMAGYFNGTSFSENYKPLSDIGGDHKTRRIYGVMAGFDEPQKIVTGLQLLQAGVIDVETLQDNIDGLENIAKVQERIRKNKAETVLFESVLSRSAQGDAAATMAVIAIYDNPNAMTDILKQFYTPEEPQLSPEQMAMIQQQQMAQAVPQQPPSMQEAFGLV
jgi:hypothetical protein